jgi:hypothetical protein
VLNHAHLPAQVSRQMWSHDANHSKTIPKVTASPFLNASRLLQTSQFLSQGAIYASLNPLLHMTSHTTSYPPTYDPPSNGS